MPAYVCVRARVHERVNEPGCLFRGPVRFWSPQGPLFLLAPARPRGAGDKAAATRPALSFSARARLRRPPACSRAAGLVRSPGRRAVLPGAGRVGRRSLAGTYARWPREPEPAVPTMATTWRPLPPLQLRFATGLYSSGKAEDPGCVSRRAAGAGKAGACPQRG